MGFFKSDKKGKENKELISDSTYEKSSPEVEMVIDSIKYGFSNGTMVDEENFLPTIHYPSNQRVLILKEKTGERCIPIWIGHYEAEAIAVKIKGLQLDRPLTHDFLCNIILNLGVTVQKVVVNDFRNDIHFAISYFNSDGRTIGIDCRPSDAINVALRMNAPIFVAEDVLNKVSFK
jgi:bifunctional DNase/RNase